MYKYLTLAVLLTTLASTASAIEVNKQNATAKATDNKMDTNHDGMVSLKEANSYGNKTAAQAVEGKNKDAMKVKKTKKDSDKKAQEKNTGSGTRDSSNVQPLEDESQFPWSNSK